MITYLFQVIIFQLAFLLMYNFFFQKETFYAYNRFYLLLTPLLSIFLPLIKIDSLNRHIPTDMVIKLTSFRNNIDGRLQQIETLSLSKLLIWVWLIGSLIFLIRMIVRFYTIKNIIDQNKQTINEPYKVIEIENSKHAFSFFNYIFLGDKILNSNREIIKDHEIQHVNLRHSYDIIYFELLKIIYWFNPINYLMNHKMKALHEFSVDSKLTIKKDKNAYYQSLLSQIFDVENIPIVNRFFRQSLIKNRILMLQKSKSKRIFLMKYILLIPALSFMLVYTSCKAQAQSEIITGVKALRNSIAKSGNITDEEMREIKVLYALTMEDGLTNPLLKDVRDYLDIPSGVLPEIPVYPGCTGTNDALKSCFNSNLQSIIKDNLDSKDNTKFEKLSKIVLTFRVDTKGNSSNAQVDIKNDDLRMKVEQIINTKLPNIKPASLQGNKVGVRMDITLE